ncbi:MAG: hypothetical protein JWP97_2410 [Labilithrix sp.]|nr:hypothetical protein [Labilithrix sp.]
MKSVSQLEDMFRHGSARVARGVGTPWAFVGAFMVIVVWAMSGPVFKFSDTWQLVINTSTTIVTFLMVFLIQNTQNRDSHALHLKLDELIRVNRRARDRLMCLEALDEKELTELQEEFDRLAVQRVAERVAEKKRGSRPTAAHARKGAGMSGRDHSEVPGSSSSTTGARSSRAT